jgi:hypothetical protein
MNSKQRRKDKRKYRYRITIDHDTWQEYEEAWWWLANRYGRTVNTCGWRDRASWRSARWEFDNEKTFVAFALAWAGD